MLGLLIEAAIVLFVAVGAFALFSILGLFPDDMVALILAIVGSFGAYLYGRFARRPGTRVP